MDGLIFQWGFPVNLLNNYEATVQCITHKYDHLICGITFGKEYKVIGRDSDGHYLVLDESNCCYFYPNDVFKIIDGPYGILEETSVYYNFRGGYNFD